MDNLNEQVAAEKDTRDVWVNRFSVEQKMHQQTIATMIELQAEKELFEINSDNLRQQLETFKEGKEIIQHHYAKLSDSFVVLQTEVERCHRQLEEKQLSLEVMEKNNKLRQETLRLELKEKFDKQCCKTFMA